MVRLAHSAVLAYPTASSYVIRGLVITNFGGSGLLIGLDGPSDNNIFADNSITNNGYGSVVSGAVEENDGASVCDGVGNLFDGNDFNNNASWTSILAVMASRQMIPATRMWDRTTCRTSLSCSLLHRPADQRSVELPLHDQLHAAVLQQLRLLGRRADSAGCDPDTVTTDDVGNVLFTVNVGPLGEGVGVFSTATQAGTANTSEYSNCVRASDDNTTWPNAKLLSSVDELDQYLDLPGQSRWYKFPINPDSRILLKLFNLPKNYDLALFSDIAQAYAEQVSQTNVDLERIGAESAPTNFNPTNFNPTNFNPTNFNPTNFNPTNFNPTNFNPTNFNGVQNSGEATAPAIFSPTNFNPTNFNPTNFNPTNFNPTNFNGNAYSAAQTASVIRGLGQ